MSDNRVRIWFSVFVLVVFAVGLGTGILIGRRMGPPPFSPGFGSMFGGRAGPPGGRLIERLSDELQLTDDQRAKIDTILASHRGKLEQINRDVTARAEEERRAMRDEIRQVLTPEQQQRFDKFLASSRRGPFGRGTRGYRNPGP